MGTRELEMDTELDFAADDDADDESDSLDAIDCEENSALDDYDWIKWTPALAAVNEENAYVEKADNDLNDVDIDLDLDLKIELDTTICRGFSRSQSPESPGTPTSPLQSQSDVSSLFDAECTV